jgi:hypothetical protein
MKSTTSPQQVAWGTTLGILLQPVSLIIVLAFVTATTKPGTESRGWGMMGAFLGYFLYFGMAQVLTILPAALLLLPTGRHGVVRGLLRVGTFLALGNMVLFVFLYAVFHWSIF